MKYQRLIVFLMAAALAIPALPPALTLFPALFSKVLLFQLLVGIAFAFVVMGGNGSMLFRGSNLGIAFAFFLVTQGIASLTAIDPLQSFWGDQMRSHGLILWIHLFFFFVIATELMRDQKSRLTLLISTILGGSIAALIGLAQYFIPTLSQYLIGEGGKIVARDRVFGTLGNPIFFASYCFLVIISALLLFKESKKLDPLFCIWKCILGCSRNLFSRKSRCLDWVCCGSDSISFFVDHNASSSFTNI